MKVSHRKSLANHPDPESCVASGITVVLPAYNEAENIEAMVEVIHIMNRLANDYEVIVVDDGSRDGTPELITSLKQRYPQLYLVQHHANQGYGAAVSSGFTRASKELVFLTDSDRQFEFREVEKFLGLIDDAERTGSQVRIGTAVRRRFHCRRQSCGELLQQGFFGHRTGAPGDVDECRTA